MPPPRPLLRLLPAAAPFSTVTPLRVRLPPGATSRMRNGGAVAIRLMVAPLPVMVSVLVMTGRPLAPRVVVVLSTALRVYVQLWARDSSSTGLARLMAWTRSAALHGTLV